MSTKICKAEVELKLRDDEDEEEEVGEHQSPFQQLPAQSQDTEECSTAHLSTSRERHTSRPTIDQSTENKRLHNAQL